MDLMRSVVRRAVGSRFARDAGWLATGNVILLILGAAQLFVVARVLGPTSYGVATLVMSVPLLVFSVLKVRSQDPGIRYLSLFHAQGRKDDARAMAKLCWTVDSGIGVASAVVVLIVGTIAANHVVHRPDVVSLMAVFALSLVFESASTSAQSVHHSLGLFGRTTKVASLLGLVRAVLIIGGAATVGTFAAIVWANIIYNVVSGVVWFVAGNRAARSHWGAPWFTARLSRLHDERREILRFFLLTDAESLLAVLVKQGDVVIVGAWGTPTAAGYYRLAKAVATTMGNIASPLETVAYPRIARGFAAGDAQALRELLRRYTRIISIPSAIACALVIPFVPWVVPLAAGNDFRPASLAAQILLGRVAVRFAVFWVSPLLLTLGHAGFLLVNRVVSSILALVGFALLIPRYDIEGAALTVTATALIASGAAYLYSLASLNRHVVSANSVSATEAQPA